MGIKKYSSGQWVDIPYRKYGTETDTITTLPKEIITDGQPIGANLANLYNVDKTSLDLRFTTDNNMTIKINGTKSSGMNVISLVYPDITLPAGQYTVRIKMISGTISGITDGVFFGINANTYLQRTTPGVLQVGDVGIRTFTLANDTVLSSIDIAPGYGSYGSVFTDAVFECMLVSGSYTTQTIPPYEPYAPTIIKGNMSQSGTPSPTTPIQPSETGDKTANLFDKSVAPINAYPAANGTMASSPNTRTAYCVCEPNTTYTISKIASKRFIVAYTKTMPAIGENFYGNITDFEATEITITTGADALYLIIFYYHASYDTLTESEIKDSIMVVEGSTAPSTYIPYGYKIPILSGNVTTDVYLGEVQSTRQIYKAVFSGNENWQLVENSSTNRFFNISLSHNNFPIALTSSPSVSAQFSTIVFISNGAIIRIYDNVGDFATETDFKTYLQQQYAAGTPVCVWYVLATPRTTTLNEPIRKIGNYADSVSVTNIPTTSGGIEFDVLTTLKPSEVDLTYHGWHPKTPKESNNGQWS